MSDDEVEMAADDEGTDQQHEMADHLSGGSSEDGGEDPNHEMNSDRGTNTSDESAGEDVMNEDRANSVPSGDDTPEDPMEHVFDPTFNGEKKIYAGSSVTMAALLLLLMAFILKHGLSKAATKHLLELLNFVVPGCVPKSVWYLEKYFLDYNDKTEIHFYCPRCANYLGVEPGNECGVCQQSLNRKGLLEKAYYFLVMPLKVQLRNILANVQSKLGKHFTRDASISDINTGSEYRREAQEVNTDSITLTFNCDGAPVFNSSKTSIWPILCTINELPFVDRCKNCIAYIMVWQRETQGSKLLHPIHP
ncbi:uncharacterized protein LOC117483615 isoform X2 [Trematomus bernacchii]|uniref:uncharacterized protein LOC117483615 isoform X2 n=1 Tax=Trematomus bernacchii TaxID=40690 RepID=UPI00146D2056|nr:uncharacterized protein LOC117483615 isoform X2 [Trematomus bernacchii]